MSPHSQGASVLDDTMLPNRKWEPYRYSNLDALFRKPVQLAQDSGPIAASEEMAKLHRMPEAAGQQLVFVNGVYSADLSDLSGLEGGVRVGSVLEMGGLDDSIFGELRRLPEFGADINQNTCQGALPFAALNAVGMRDAAVILIPDESTVEKPVQVLFLSTGPGDDSDAGCASFPRLLVMAGKGSRTTIVQTFAGEGAYFCDGLTQCTMAANAHLTHIHVQEQSLSSRHVDTVRVDLKEDAQYLVSAGNPIACYHRKLLTKILPLCLHQSRFLSSGSADSRTNAHIEMAEKGAGCEVMGLCVAYGHQALDLHTTIGHGAADTTSVQEQRNVLSENSECVFKGRIRVDEEAAGTDSAQMCRTLMLSDKARITAMPSLEIIADDVACSHGCTVADLDEEQLFYLESRGINNVVAKGVVVRSFAIEILGKVPYPSLAKAPLEKLETIAPDVQRAVKSFYSSI
jgi:Fe-S cluster assembly protein SufD